jgi:hypothetical protein
MFDWLKKIVVNKYAASLIRHGLGMLSGYLVAIGVSEDVASGLTTQLIDITINSLPGVIALVWSFFEKKKKS